MNTRKLGGQGLVVSEVGLGCMGMSEFYGPVDDDESIATIHRAIDLGVTSWTPPTCTGRSRTSAWSAERSRESATRSPSRRSSATSGARTGRGSASTARPEYVRAACDASLKRLGVDVIDLYYQHRVDSKVPIEETVGAMALLVKEGKVRYLGLSEAAPATIRRAHKVHPISALQTEYSLWSREPEDEILPTIRELGIGFVAYSPLGRGMLSGRIRRIDDLAADDRRRMFPRFQGANFAKNMALVDRIRTLADERKATVSQLALAWVLARGGDVAPIFGTKRRSYLEENVQATEITLAPDDLARIDAASPKGAAAGQRYPDMSSVNR